MVRGWGVKRSFSIQPGRWFATRKISFVISPQVHHRHQVLIELFLGSFHASSYFFYGASSNCSQKLPRWKVSRIHVIG